MATSMLKVSTSSQKVATSMLKVASDIYKTPLYRTAHSLRTPQTSGQYAFCISDLPLWSLKLPSSRRLKLSFFICPRVSARFQGLQWVLWLAKYDKGCRNCRAENHDVLHKNDVNSKLLKSECSARWALLIRGPGIRVPSDNQAPGGGFERQHGLRSKVIDHLTEIFKHWKSWW